ncbi:MAG: extracellular solute-binding protein, partial [Oscillospiraceae bacterium]|nr:extracellular solute-binding protein [Oscillospiraceae bacterium]
LALALALVMIVALVACGASTPAASTTTPAETKTETPAEAPAASGLPYEGHTLYVANWQAYNSDQDYCEKAFEDMTGAQVEHVYFNSYDELMTTLMTGGSKTIDAVVLSNNYTQWFHDEGLIMNVDPAKIPNYAEVAGVYKDLKPYAVDDAGNLFAFPWCNGTSSIAYNPELCPIEIEHWSDLLNPALKGHVMILDGDGDDWVIGCLLAGEDSDDIANADIEKVRASLAELKSQLLGFWASNDEQIQPWLSGDFWAGEIWSGPYSTLYNDPSTSIKLVHPSEGTVGYIDYWAVVNGTDEFDLACEWINWIESYEEQYAMATGESDKYPGEYYTYTPVNAKVIEGLTPEQKIALELDPMPTVIKLLPYIADPDVKDAWVDLYQEFVGG